MGRVLNLLMLVLAMWLLPACQAARREFLKSEVGRVVPVPAEQEGMKTEIDASYTMASVTIRFTSHQPPARVLADYRRELGARRFVEMYPDGKEIPAPPATLPQTGLEASPTKTNGSKLCQFKRGSDLLWEDFITFTLSGDALAGPSEVTIVLRHNSYLGEAAKLPVALPVSVILLPLLFATGALEGYANLVYQYTGNIVDALY